MSTQEKLNINNESHVAKCLKGNFDINGNANTVFATGEFPILGKDRKNSDSLESISSPSSSCETENSINYVDSDLTRELSSLDIKTSSYDSTFEDLDAFVSNKNETHDSSQSEDENDILSIKTNCMNKCNGNIIISENRPTTDDFLVSATVTDLYTQVKEYSEELSNCAECVETPQTRRLNHVSSCSICSNLKPEHKWRKDVTGGLFPDVDEARNALKKCKDDLLKRALQSERHIPRVKFVGYKSELQMPSIMRLIQNDLSEPYSIYTYRYFIHNWPHLCFMAMHDEDAVGAIVCKLDVHRKTTKRGYIAMLAVDKNFRKIGVGSSLVLKAIRAMVTDGAEEIVLETEVTNLPALQLYSNLGFVRDKRLFRYYLNGVDALRLKLWLK